MFGWKNILLGKCLSEIWAFRTFFIRKNVFRKFLHSGKCVRKNLIHLFLERKIPLMWLVVMVNNTIRSALKWEKNSSKKEKKFSKNELFCQSRATMKGKKKFLIYWIRVREYVRMYVYVFAKWFVFNRKIWRRFCTWEKVGNNLAICRWVTRRVNWMKQIRFLASGRVYSVISISGTYRKF